MNAAGTLGALFRAVVSLAFVIALIYFISWLLRRYAGMFTPRASGRRLLELEEVLPLGPGRLIYLVRTGTKRILVASSTQGLTLLGELDAGGGPGAVGEPGASGEPGAELHSRQQGAHYQRPGHPCEDGVPRGTLKGGSSGILAMIALTALLSLLAGLCPVASAQAAPSQTVPFPRIEVGIGQARSPQDVATSLQILAALTVLTLAPSILIMMTSFTRIVIVLSFIRNALGFQQTPPNQVIIGLALFLTLFVMAPTFNQVNENALQPYLKGRLSQEAAYQRAMEPIRAFMLKQTREKDLALFVGLARVERPRRPADVPTYVLIPAFVISELKSAFEIGFVLYIPFLVIDMVVASTLMSMGMLMLPPVMISLPFKLLLFVMVDGWNLVIGSLIKSFH
ncbi:MAG TPA: flagellar type III secretion system pore protein FliP [Firmicutes bacterium]|nr:flagellar type III secretion system pore protein FliP [Bacillota bacterium]